MSIDKSILEPEKTALIISTGKHRNEDSVDYKSKLFWWYVGQARTIGASNYYNIRQPAVKNDNLLVLVDNDTSQYDSRNWHNIGQLFPGSILWSGSRRVKSLAATNDQTYCSMDACKFVQDEGGGRTPDKIVRLENGQLIDFFQHLCRIQDISANSNSLFVLDSDRPERGIYWPQSITRSGSSQKIIWEKDRHNYLKSLHATDANLYVGGLANIVTIDLKSNLQTSYMHDEEAFADTESFIENSLRVDQDSSIFSIIEKKARLRGYDEWRDFTPYSFYFYKYSISNITEHNGQVMYSIGKKLYMMGERNPIHTFRWPITGLAALPIEVLDELKERSDLRMGSKNRKGKSKLFPLAAAA